jgi:hypothetical protein
MARWGVTVTTDQVAALTCEKDFVELIAGVMED